MKKELLGKITSKHKLQTQQVRTEKATEQMRANLYGQLLNEHTRIGNKISEIKGQNIEPNQKQKEEIRKVLQSRKNV